MNSSTTCSIKLKVHVYQIAFLKELLNSMDLLIFNLFVLTTCTCVQLDNVFALPVKCMKKVIFRLTLRASNFIPCMGQHG